MLVKQQLTVEEFQALPEPRDARYELVNGEVVVVTGTGGVHSVIASAVHVLLAVFVSTHKLGRALGDGASFVLSTAPATVRIPDASFLSYERFPAEEVPVGFWPLPPDLAVEIVSPNDRAAAIDEKVRLYLAAGVRLVWVIWPDERTVTTHTLNGPPQQLAMTDILTGGNVLPGFSVSVSVLFADIP